ncbi:MAG: hypothetical protein JW779_14910 [Candidatus Thorarchaeota archaeon]|nr:hypothetical protein [Candidatus Thorarchaeota archaeon]
MISQTSETKATIEVHDIKDVFDVILEYKYPPKRGEFETLEDYKKRLPTPYDSSSIWYVFLEAMGDARNKPYEYDIDNEMLTFVGGSKYELPPKNYEPLQGYPICVKVRNKELGSYEATNAFGATINVEKTHFEAFVVNYVNESGLPEVAFDRANGVFSCSIEKPPKEAEQLSQQLELAIEIKPVNPLNCAEEDSDFDLINPTMNFPYEMSSSLYWVDAQFVSLVLYNKSTLVVQKRILCKDSTVESQKFH